MSLDKTHEVDLTVDSAGTTRTPSPLILTDLASVTLTWDPQRVLPSIMAEHLQPQEPFTVDIILYALDTDSAQWAEFVTLAMSVSNSGSHTVVLPEGAFSEEIVPITFHVAVSFQSTAQQGVHAEVLRTQQRVGVWTAEYYYINPLSLNEATSMRSKCREWHSRELQEAASEGSDNVATVMAASQPCGATVERALVVGSGLTEVNVTSIYGSGSSRYHDRWMQTFHPGARRCFRQALHDPM